MTLIIAGIYAFVSLVVLFISPPELQPNTSIVGEIVQALRQGNQLSAKTIWDSIEYPLFNETGPGNNFLQKHWFREILHKSQNQTSKENLDPTFSKHLSTFIHLSVEHNLKADFYTKLLNSVGHLNDSDFLFTLGKYILKDNVKDEAVIVDAEDHDLTTIGELMPYVVWTALLKIDFLLQNVKYGSFLYVSEVNGKEILLWKKQQFINQAQEIFQLNSVDGYQKNGTGSENVFKLINRNQIGLNDVYVQSQQKNGTTPTLGIMSQTPSKLDTASKFWNIQLKDDNTIRTFNVNGNQKEYLCALNSSYDLDALRGRATLFSSNTVTEQGLITHSDCAWKVKEM